MEWPQVAVLIFGNMGWMIPIFLWIRSESRADIRQIEAKIDVFRKEIKDEIGDVRKEMKSDRILLEEKIETVKKEIQAGFQSIERKLSFVSYKEKESNRTGPFARNPKHMKRH